MVIVVCVSCGQFFCYFSVTIRIRITFNVSDNADVTDNC